MSAIRNLCLAPGNGLTRQVLSSGFDFTDYATNQALEIKGSLVIGQTLGRREGNTVFDDAR